MRKSTTFRLTLEVRELLVKLSKWEGISQSAIIETVIRERAAKRGITNHDRANPMEAHAS